MASAHPLPTGKVLSAGQGGGRSLPLITGCPMSCKGQALAQFISLSGHQPQLNGQVLHLLVHLPVGDEGWWGRRLPSGAWQEEKDKVSWHLVLSRGQALFCALSSH